MRIGDVDYHFLGNIDGNGYTITGLTSNRPGDAVTVSIPTGATDKELKLTITKLLDTQSLVTNKQVLATSIYEILKNFPENFGKPVTLTFVFDPASVKKDQRPAIFYYDEVKKVWVEVKGGKINGNRISVDVDHFTKFAVIVVDPTVVVPEPEQPKEPTGIDAEVKFGDIAGHWGTRAEMAAMIANALRQPIEANAVTGFADDKDIRAWAKGSVAIVKQAGIIQGKSGPQDNATRAEAVTVLMKMLALQSK
ncbi:S-layer homology domain-containing protein [Cohnella herbarum]|uniref:S-layer homology domain-containing protein n=1 Tax=Cohnella herbarum TaxID=2728023 RepID=A0A7Z2VKQ6_9BACL|nr:S-layer homology domain-containing protein [Cohnella herbarum]QJD84674.1 S-layer homology domain-containing protein [Cohnella herbarum]